MTDNDLPKPGTVEGEALSFDEGVLGLSELLGPASDPDEDAAKTGEVEDEDVEGDEPDAEDVDDEAEGDEDTESEDEEAEEADEPETPVDEMIVTGPDGSKMTVAELREFADKRARDFQRDYTRKTDEVKARSMQVEQAAQTLAQERDFLVQLVQQYMPQEPDPSMLDVNSTSYDPSGYMYAKDQYDRRLRAWQQLRQGQQWEMQRRQSEIQAEQQRTLVEQQKMLLDKMPELKDPAKFQNFAQEAMQYGADVYAFSPEEVAAVNDSRYLHVLADAIAYRKLKAEKPKVRQELKGKPKPLRGGKRENPQTKEVRSRQAASETLRKTGAFDAGVAALMNLDL